MPAPITGRKPGGAGPLLSVQILRAVAVLLVLAYHVQHDVVDRLGFAEYPRLTPFAASVDLFFTISGFIMVWASRDLFARPGILGTYFVRRMFRVVPLYWIITTAFLAITLLAPAVTRRQIETGHLVASYFFVPWPDHNGDSSPFFGLGWTLNHEMFFYLAFGLVLLLPLRRAVATLSAGFAALVALGLMVDDLPFALRIWSLPLILEFVAGAWIAVARMAGVTLPGWLRIALVATAVGMVALTDLLPAVPTMENRVIWWGIPAALAMAGVTLGADAPARRWSVRLFAYLGDASYSIYLVHIFVVAGMRPLAARWRDVVALSPLTYAALVFLLAVGVSVLVYRRVEAPLYRAMLGVLRRRRAAVPARAAAE